MAEIMEVFDDIKDTVGKKSYYILIVVAVLFGAYNLFKNPSQGQTMTNVTMRASYPDAVTNADVIISTLQNSIDYTEGEIREEIQGVGSNISYQIDDNFEATNDFINKGFESQTDLMNKNFDEIHGSLEDVSAGVSGIGSQVKSLNDTTSKIQTQLNGLKTSPVTTTSSSSGSSASYYHYRTKSGLNTSTSIVDALKAIGVNSSMSFRKQIAQANGISGYTGTYNQNVTLLSKLKAGTLRKV